MAKMTLEELRELRQAQRSEMERRNVEGKECHIIVGMGTCGIAAGAKQTVEALLKSIQSHNLLDVVVKQTGCMGLCYVEPTVEVKVPGMPDTLYGNVNEEVAKEIVETHILGKRLVDGHVQDRPAGDMLN